MEYTGEWCLIESDPDIFTQLIKAFGVKGVQVEELWSLDEQIIEEKNLRNWPLHGFIFLFKWIQDEEPSGPVVQDNRLEKIYFAKQVIGNICATQAVINILMNCNHPDVELGPELTKLKEFSQSFDARVKGLTLSNSLTIRAAHNSMSPVLLDFGPKVKSGKAEDVYHFIAYIPIEGRLYELDGLQEGPIDLGPVNPDQHWIDVLRPIIMKRVNKYKEGEICFNLMAMVSDRMMTYSRQLEELKTEAEALGMTETDIESDVQRIQSLIAMEYVRDNTCKGRLARIRHNYLPFIVELLKVLGEKRMLVPIYDAAKKRALEKSAKKMKV